MLHMDTGYGESSRRAHDGAILGLGHQLCEQKMMEGIDTGYSMLKQDGATPFTRLGACHSKTIRYEAQISPQCSIPVLNGVLFF